MKYFIVSIVFVMSSCNGQLLDAPATPQTVWIDAATRSDTIITNVDNHDPLLYYASKNWQQSPDTSLTHGYRFIAIRFKDSILVKPFNDVSTNYRGPFILKANKENDTLTAQNFIDTVNTYAASIFIRLR